MIEVRTWALNKLRKELGIELRKFHTAQYKAMKKATQYVQKEARQELRSIFFPRTGRMVKGLRRRVRRVGQGEFRGLIFFAKSAFYGRILQGPSVVRARAKGDVIGRRGGFPVIAEVGKSTEPEVVKILGASFKVFMK